MNAAGGDAVLYAVADRVATITIDRPEARNALNSEVLRLLPKYILEAEADDGVDVIILTGTDPAFSAGVDLKEAAAGGQGDADAAIGAVVESRQGPFPPHTKPLIGAVNGVAVTGGLEVALGCDFLIASDQARFADTHARVGVMPGWGLTVMLPQAIGVRRAREMSTTGNYVDAEQALCSGISAQAKWLISSVRPWFSGVEARRERGGLFERDAEPVHAGIDMQRRSRRASCWRRRRRPIRQARPRLPITGRSVDVREDRAGARRQSR